MEKVYSGVQLRISSPSPYARARAQSESRAKQSLRKSSLIFGEVSLAECLVSDTACRQDEFPIVTVDRSVDIE